MKLLLPETISFLASHVIVLLAAGCLGVVAWKFCRWLPTVELWRLRRSTITALIAAAAVAAILAQKGDRGTGDPPAPVQQTGDPPVESGNLDPAPDEWEYFTPIASTNATRSRTGWMPFSCMSATSHARVDAHARARRSVVQSRIIMASITST